MIAENNHQELTIEDLEALLKEKKDAERLAKNKERENYEALKEDTVTTLINQALIVSEVIKTFKGFAFDNMEAIHELLKAYSQRHADGKGNFTLENKAGDMRINYKRQDLGYFDERSVMAEQHIKDFVKVRFAGDADAQEAITILLERNKDKLDIKMVQKLYSMEDSFDDGNWKEGIKLLKESWTPSGSKFYITFHTKVNNDWQLINLSFSNA